MIECGEIESKCGACRKGHGNPLIGLFWLTIKRARYAIGNEKSAMLSRNTEPRMPMWLSFRFRAAFIGSTTAANTCRSM
jgi:hypothetical protein